VPLQHLRLVDVLLRRRRAAEVEIERGRRGFLGRRLVERDIRRRRRALRGTTAAEIEVEGGRRRCRRFGRRGSRGRRRITAAVDAVLRVDRAAQRGSLVPLGPLAVGELLQLHRRLLERLRVFAMRIDLEQFRLHRNALRILGQRFLQDFLGLRIAAVSHVDVGFRNGIDFFARGCGGSSGGGRRAGGRRDAASGGRRSKRRGRADGGSRSGGAKHAVLEFRLSGLFATPGNVAIGDEQYDEAAQQSEIERVVEEFVDDARFGYRGALLRLGLRRFGLLRVRARRCGLGGGGRWRGDRLGGLGCGGLGRFDGRLGGFRRRRGLRDRRGRGRRGGRSRRRRRLGRGLPLQFGKLLVLHLQQLAQVARVLLQVGLARLRFRERALARHRIVVTRSLRTRAGLGGLGLRK